jgi:hypothetical protein
VRAAAAALMAALAFAGAAGPSAAAPPPPSGRHVCPRPPAGPPTPEGYDARELVGLRVGKAKRVAERHGCTLRVVRRDGEWLVVTQDFRTDRINVAVRDRVVRRIVGIY